LVYCMCIILDAWSYLFLKGPRLISSLIFAISLGDLPFLQHLITDQCSNLAYGEISESTSYRLFVLDSVLKHSLSKDLFALLLGLTRVCFRFQRHSRESKFTSGIPPARRPSSDLPPSKSSNSTWYHEIGPNVHFLLGLINNGEFSKLLASL